MNKTQTSLSSNMMENLPKKIDLDHHRRARHHCEGNLEATAIVQARIQEHQIQRTSSRDEKEKVV